MVPVQEPMYVVVLFTSGRYATPLQGPETVVVFTTPIVEPSAMAEVVRSARSRAEPSSFPAVHSLVFATPLVAVSKISYDSD